MIRRLRPALAALLLVAVLAGLTPRPAAAGHYTSGYCGHGSITVWVKWYVDQRHTWMGGNNNYPDRHIHVVQVQQHSWGVRTDFTALVDVWCGPEHDDLN